MVIGVALIGAIGAGSVALIGAIGVGSVGAIIGDRGGRCTPRLRAPAVDGPWKPGRSSFVKSIEIDATKKAAGIGASGSMKRPFSGLAETVRNAAPRQST
jgi:hypothetical protein